MSGALIQLAATGAQDVYLTSPEGSAKPWTGGTDYEIEHRNTNYLMIFAISFFCTLVFVWVRASTR